MAHDVFISYSHKDKPVADAVVAGLENKGVRCWLAPRDIALGSSYLQVRKPPFFGGEYENT